MGYVPTKDEMKTYKEVINNNNLKILLDYPLKLYDDDPKHLIIFRRILEWYMTYGIWNGQMAMVS